MIPLAYVIEAKYIQDGGGNVLMVSFQDPGTNQPRVHFFQCTKASVYKSCLSIMSQVPYNALHASHTYICRHNFNTERKSRQFLYIFALVYHNFRWQAEIICNQVNQAKRLVPNSQRSNKVLTLFSCLYTLVPIIRVQR